MEGRGRSLPCNAVSRLYNSESVTVRDGGRPAGPRSPGCCAVQVVNCRCKQGINDRQVIGRIYIIITCNFDIYRRLLYLWCLQSYF